MVKSSIKSRWNSFDEKFRKEIKILIGIFIVTAIFDSGSTFLGTNGDINILLQKEGNPFVTKCATITKSITPCLVFPKIIGGSLWFVGSIMMIVGGFIVISKVTSFRPVHFLEPLITSSLITVSIQNILAGLTWYGVKIWIIFYQFPFLPTILLLVLFFIEFYRWQKIDF